jgi:hypothetical protein
LLTLWWARKDWLTIGTIVAAVGLLIACWFIKHAEPLRFVVVSPNRTQNIYSLVADILSSFSSVSCHPYTVSGTSVMISSFEKSMSLTLAYLPKDMAVLHNAGESSGLSYRFSSWLVAYLLVSRLFPRIGKNKKMIRRKLFPLELPTERAALSCTRLEIHNKSVVRNRKVWKQEECRAP